MSSAPIKQIRLDPEQIRDKESMAAFMKQALDLPEYFGGNLDALSDVLSEVTSEVVFEVDAVLFENLEETSYAKKVLKVISDAETENAHLHLYLMM